LSIPGFQHGGRQTEDPAQQFQGSVEAYERAIALDKSFAPAYAGLAYVYALRSVQFPLAHADDELVKMRDAADKALQLDPLLPETHHALAMAYARDGKWAFAEASFRRSIELDPNHASTHSDYAYWLLAVLGRYEDALTQLRAAGQADPLSNDVLFTTALVYAQAQRYDEASGLCARLPFPAQCFVRVRLSQERFGEAIALLESNPDLMRNPQNRGFLGLAYARTGRRADAEKLLAAATVPNEQALICAGLGDRDRTYDALKRMANFGPQRVGLYLSFPDFAFLRGDERLRAFRESLGLP
jgi:tetratricopeptide (TPR) repeat protein